MGSTGSDKLFPLPDGLSPQILLHTTKNEALSISRSNWRQLGWLKRRLKSKNVWKVWTMPGLKRKKIGRYLWRRDEIASTCVKINQIVLDFDKISRMLFQAQTGRINHILDPSGARIVKIRNCKLSYIGLCSQESFTCVRWALVACLCWWNALVSLPCLLCLLLIYNSYSLIH